MSRKSIGRTVVSILLMGLFIIIGTLLYNQWNTFDFAKKLYEKNEIYLSRRWVPYKEESGKVIVIDEAEKDEILELIISRPYYKWHIEGYKSFWGYDEIEIIAISIISVNEANDRLEYECLISNTGQIEIRNRDEGKSNYYSLRKWPLSWLDIEGKDIKELYNKLQELLN